MSLGGPRAYPGTNQIRGGPWPGVPIRGRNALGKAHACWLPIAPGLTPHGLRHSYKTLMIELGTPATLMDAQMGHEDGSVQALYSHITSGMRQRLLDGLTELWTAALGARREFSPRSPVAVLDRLLGGDAERSSPSRQDRLPGFSQTTPETRIGLRPDGTKPALTWCFTWWAILGSNQ